MADRQLSRQETHDLSMIIKDRSKVLKAHAEEQAAACLAEFERKVAAAYDWDHDSVWQTAAERARDEALRAQQIIAERCKELGIPRTFAPRISVNWEQRGENAIRQRRMELRLVAEAEIRAMTKAAITKIEKQTLDLRTQVVAMGLYSDDAKMFLESLAPVTEAMRSIDFAEVEQKLEKEQLERQADRRRLYGH